MLSSGIVTIYREGVFTLEEARQLLPVIRRITQEHSQRVNELMGRLETMEPGSQQGLEIEKQINSLISSWHSKIKKLGADSKGLWLVDFDSGDGHYCWKYPESELNYWHSYSDGFSNRQLVEDCSQPKPSRISEKDSSL